MSKQQIEADDQSEFDTKIGLEYWNVWFKCATHQMIFQVEVEFAIAGGKLTLYE